MTRLIGTGALALLALGGCGSKDDTAGTGDGTATATATATATGATATGATGTGPGTEPFCLIGNPATMPPAAILSVWGTGPDDVYMVGADDDTGPVVLHYDGAAWSRLDTGTRGDLWWVWGDGDDTVFFSGNAGRVVTYTVSTGEFVETAVADPAIKLFGTWGTSATDVWTVGGDPNLNQPGVMYHFDGTDWELMGNAPDSEGGGKRQSFKVWGSATDDVWVVGTGALIMHWDGTEWTEVASPLYHSIPLTTVHGNGNQVYAVGGFGNAAVARLVDGQWVDDTPPPIAIAPFFNGVFVDPNKGVITCGGNGQVWTRDDAEGWAVDARTPVAGGQGDLHACWVDSDGGEWSVGGDLTGLSQGMVIYAGPNEVPPIAL